MYREEVKRSKEEGKEMIKYAEKVEKQYQDREASKKDQLRKIQQENLKVAMAKKNDKVQNHVSDSLKEEAMIKNNPFNYESDDTR